MELNRNTPVVPFGRYRLIALLATGGMAEIYLATQTGAGGFEKLVVIKRVLPNMERNKRLVGMILDEASIAARIVHKNVVQIFDVGQIEGRTFIAMEYLDGENLATVVDSSLRRGDGLPRDLAAGIIMQAAEGLHHAHTATDSKGKHLGIVHRDVSPQNILVQYNGVVKLVDFGIARANQRITETRTGVLKGKLAYMSPEQVLGRELDGRSDVFSLGVVMWECLLGERLFAMDNDLATLEAITGSDVPSPLTVDPDMPEALCQIMLRALARDREARYQSAAEMRAAIRSYLKSTRAEADTAAISRFMQKLYTNWIRKKRDIIDTIRSQAETSGRGADGNWWSNRWTILFGAVAVVAIVAGLAWSGWFTAREERRPAKAPASTGKSRNGGLTAGRRKKPVRQTKKIRPRLDVDAGEKKARRKPTGKLRLMTTPWTIIYYKGRKIGQTPLVDERFPAGTIELRAVNEKAGIDKIIRVRIKPGEVVLKRHSFH
jgi:eukaryotic-like serine/threonine-protein kinase